MAKRRREADSDGTTPAPATYNTIFIDTSLNSHLAMIVTDSDTVSVLKEKIVAEHTRCFPRFGEIRIDALKVKRKGFFYHLPDYMHVKSAFEGVKKSWFLYVDMSMMKVYDNTQPLVKLDVSNQKALACIVHCPQGHDQQDLLPDDRSKTPSHALGSANGKVASGLGFMGEVSKDIANGVGCNVDGQFNDSSPTTSKSSALRVQKAGVAFENKNNRVSETSPGFKDDKSIDGIGNNHASTLQSLETANPAKKHKRKRNAVAACSAVKNNNASVCASQEDASRYDVKSTENKEDNKIVGSNVESESLKDDYQTRISSGNKTKRKRIKDPAHHHDQAEASVLSSTQVMDVQRSFEQNAAIGSENNVQHELSPDQPHHGHYQDKGKGNTLPSSSKDVHEQSDVEFNGKTSTSKPNKSRKGRAASKKLDNTRAEYLPPSIMPVPHHVKNNVHHDVRPDSLPHDSEPTTNQANETREARELSPNRDPGKADTSGEDPNQGKADTSVEDPNQGKANTSVEDPNLSAKFLNVEETIADGNSSGYKQKKKKVKKSSAKVLDIVNMNQDNNQMNDVSSPKSSIATKANLSNDLESNERFVRHAQNHQIKQNEEETRPSDSDEANVTARDTGAKTMLSDANVSKVHKSAGVRKKKSARKSAMAVCQDASDMEHVGNFVTHSTKHTAENIEEERSFLSCAESKETSKRKSSDASALKACRKADKQSGENETSCPITQTVETEEKRENMDGRGRNNMEKGQNVGENNILNVIATKHGNEIELGHLDEANRGVENAGNNSKVVRKKLRKNQSFPENEHEILHINDQKVNEEITALNDRAKEVETPSKEQENEKAHIQKKSSENTKNVERKSKKKSKKNQTPAADGHSSLPINNQVAVGYVGDLASERFGEVDTSPKVNEEITDLNDRVKEVETSSKELENEEAQMQLTQMKQSAENTENVERESKKKSRKNRTLAADGHSNLPVNNQVAVGHVGDIAAERFGEVDTSSKAPESLVHVPLVQDSNNKTQRHAGSVSKKAKKAMGNRNSTAVSHSNLPIKDQGVAEDIAASIHRSKEVDSPSETTKNTRKHHLNQSAVPDSDCQNDAVENKFDGTENEANTGNLAKVAGNEGEEINFKQYFVPGEHHSEVVMKPSKETIAEKKAEKNGVPSVGTTPKLQHDLLKADKNQANVVTSAGKARNATILCKGMKTKKMQKHVPLHAPASLDLEKIRTPQKPAALPTDLKENDKSRGESSTSSSSSSESSERIPLKERNKKEQGLRRSDVTGKITSTKLRGEVVNSLKREKSLLSTPVSIFKDVSGESSGDKNGLVDSDASTRTPSDNSASSGYSSDGSGASANSTKNGADGVKRKEGKRKGIFDPELSGLKQIPMDTIFRSSSRFKKAKLTASQQLEDTEGQPIEFVPDSQAQQ